MNDNLKTSQAGLEFITKEEGLVLKPYKDIAGLRTIGVGHLIKPGENFPDGAEISREKALEILAKDVENCESRIKENIKVPLNQNQFDALVSFGFNCGVGVYANSGVVQAIRSAQFDLVPQKLLEWSKARIGGVLQISKGLYNRRKREGELFSRPIQLNDQQFVLWTTPLMTEVQTRLKKLGLYTLNIDGLFGPGTSKAITEFSKKISSSDSNPAAGISQKLLDELRKST